MSTLAATAQPTFKNRRWLLIVAGVVEILMALGTLLALAAIFLSMGRQPPPPGVDLRTVRIFSVVFYGGIAAFFFTVGVGSILAKNWARIAMLIASWFWLGVGVLSMLVMAAVVPAIMRQAETQSGRPMPTMVLVIMFAFFAAFYLLLPLAFILIYSNKHVRMTCLAHAAGASLAGGVAAPAKPGYPIAVGILVVWIGIGVVFGVPALLLMHRPYAFFGTFLYGAAGVIAGEAILLIHGYFAWQLYKLHPLGWWGTLVVSLISAASAELTLYRYGTMGFLTVILPDFQTNPAYKPMQESFTTLFPALFAVGPAIILIYLLCIRRHFKPSATEA